MQRLVFTESRAKEYFILEDLIKQTSMAKNCDGAESSGITPEIEVNIKLQEY